MNYSMQGMTKTIPELFVMLKSTKVEIKKAHQVFMIDKTTSFKKRAKGRRGASRRTASKWLLKWRSPSLEHKPETKCFYCKGNGHWKRKCPEYLVDKKDGKVNKGIFDIQVIDVCLTSVYSCPWVFDTCSVAKISNSKQELQNKQHIAHWANAIPRWSFQESSMIGMAWMGKVEPSKC